MRKFQVTSEKLDCEITFHYSDNETLTGIVISKEVTFEQLSKIIEGSCFHLKALIKAYNIPSKSHLLTEILPDISFTAFFDAYKYRLDKKRAEDVWHKLSERDQAAAIQYIPVYEKERGTSGAAKLYAKTYLQNKVWR